MNSLFSQGTMLFRYSIRDTHVKGFDEKSKRQLLGLLTSGNESLLKEWETSVSVPYELGCVRTAYDEWKLLLKLQLPQMSGRTDYRRFPLGELLFPDLVTGSYSVVSLEKTSFQKNFSALPAELDLIRVQPSAAALVTGNIENFGYSDQKIESVQEAVMQINQYWALSDYVQKVIGSATIEENGAGGEIAMLFLQREQIRKSLFLMRETAALPLMEQSGADPADVWKQLPVLQRYLVRYTTLLQQAEVGREQLHHIAAVCRADMVRSLRAALQNDFRDHELLLKTGRLLPDTSLYSLTAIFDQSGQQDGLSEILAFEVLALADSLHQAGDFANAYGYYEDAIQVLMARGHQAAANEVKERMQTSRLGLLRSYLQIASKAMSVGNETMARSYQQKSKAFIQKHPQNGLVNRIAAESDELVGSYLRKANYLIDQKQYSQAIALLEEAGTLTQTYYNLNFQEQINQALFSAYRRVFLDLVNEAQAYFSVGELAEAERRLNYAIDYQKDHNAFLRTSTEAFHLQNEIQAQRQMDLSRTMSYGTRPIQPIGAELSSMENTVIITIEEARLKVWANEMETAWRLYQQASDLAAKNNLDKKSNVREAFRQLDQGMVERICLNNRFRIDDLMKSADRMIALHEYAGLEAALKEVIELNASNQGCKLDASRAQQLLNEYADLFRYQHDFQLVTSLLYTNGLNAVMSQYLHFDQQVSQYHLERFGAEHISLPDFIRSQQNPAFTIQALSFHLNRLDTLETALYVHVLASQNFDWMSASKLLEKAASLLAVSDSKLNISDPKMRIAALVGNDRRFELFRKTYLRAMKQLAKQNKSKT